jgi:hypothetical protein
MFSKISRYRKLTDILTTDVKGRTLESKSLRLLPEVSGTFLHTVEEVDRLDHLAYKYYKQPRKWWRICDANPEFMSPLALLGKEPVATGLFPIVWEGLVPPWSVLLNDLSAQVGVEEVKMGTSGQTLPDTRVLDGTLLFAIDVGLVADLDAGVLTQELSTALREALLDEGITLGPEIKFSFVGDNRRRITDQTSKEVYTFRLEAGALNVYESVVRHTWVVMVTYNEMNMTAQAIAGRISAVDFAVEQPQPIGRVGKQIVIPRNIT